MKNTQQTCLRLTIASLLLLMCLSGCHRAINPTEDSQQRNDLNEKLYALHIRYLNSDTNQSRRCLHEAIGLLENARCLKQNELAFELWMEYARLSVLETKAGNEIIAEAYLLKTHYWRLIDLELAGESTEKAIKKVNLLTVEKCAEIVNEFEKAVRQKINSKSQ